MTKKNERLIRNSLGIIILVVALNALGGGYYGMDGAKDVPLEWLAGSPFHNYFIPGLILFTVIGCGFLITSIAIFTRRKFAVKAAVSCGTALLIWISVQLFFIGYVSWLQPAMIVAGVMMLILSFLLSPARNQVKL